MNTQTEIDAIHPDFREAINDGRARVHHSYIQFRENAKDRYRYEVQGFGGGTRAGLCSVYRADGSIDQRIAIRERDGAILIAGKWTNDYHH